MMNLQELKVYVDNSFMRKRVHTFDIPINDLAKTLHGMTFDAYEDAENEAAITTDGVYEFNLPGTDVLKGWTEDECINYLMGLILGAYCPILVYELESQVGQPGRCRVLKGEDEIVAVIRFIHGHFKVFGYTYQQLLEAGIFEEVSMRFIQYRLTSHKEAEDMIRYLNVMNYAV